MLTNWNKINILIISIIFMFFGCSGNQNETPPTSENKTIQTTTDNVKNFNAQDLTAKIKEKAVETHNTLFLLSNQLFHQDYI